MRNNTLIDSLKINDHLAMDELFDRCWEFVFDAAFKKSGDEEVTQAITQEIFISFWENRMAINKIRIRAGLSPKSAMTIVDLKRERRNELAGEWADRHRDLVRWGDAQATYAKPLHDFDGSVIWKARTFNPQVHDVWAVPQREIDNSSGLIKQNAGW